MDSLRILGQAMVNRKGAQRLRDGHPWVYRADIDTVPACAAGVVEVVDEKARFLAQALFSPASAITLRHLSASKNALNADFLRNRLTMALDRRLRALPGSDAYRWVHGEADFVPGVFIDVYGDCIALQTLCAGADKLEPDLVTLIHEIKKPRAIVIRDEGTARGREGLKKHVTLALGEAPVLARYHEGDVLLEVDLLNDQKTGGFLDQAHNHVWSARYGRGQALDCFCYHGGFALQLAAKADTVLAVDISKDALSRARIDAERAGRTNVEFLQADVMELLPRLAQEGRRFDTIVLDPPTFASGKETVEGALRAYKDINRRAMQLLSKNGILISCSCSGRVTGSMFDDMLAAASLEAKRSAQILERRAAGPDHPVLVGVPETDYLKCRVLCVV